MARPDAQPASNQPPVGYPQGYPPPDHQQEQQQPQGKPQVIYPPPPPPPLPQGQPQMYYAPPPPPPAPQTGYQGVPQAQMGMPGAPNYNNTPPLRLPMHQQVSTEGWNTGLFGCFDDPVNALITICFPCVTFGQVAEILDNGSTSCVISALLYCCIAYFIGCPCILSCTYRSKLRGRYGLIESPAPDCITHCFCECCALCQEYRELKSRDFDPAIGWQGNLTRQRNIQMQQASMIPPVNQTMMG